MKVEEIFLNPSNVLEYQCEDVHSLEGREHLRLHMQVNEALSKATSESIDSGGRYAAWLNNIGIEHQTDAGWWNETAVDHDNMQAFVDYWHAEEGDALLDSYTELKEKVSTIPNHLKVVRIAHHVTIRDILGF